MEKKEQSLISKIIGWFVLSLLIGSLVYNFTHASKSSCTINPYYGDDSCTDQYQN